MDLFTVAHGPTDLPPEAWGTLGAFATAPPRLLARRGRLRLTDVDAVYLDARRVAVRRAELVAAGYPEHRAELADRLEGRENTLLDRTLGAGLTDAEGAELDALQELLGWLEREHGSPSPRPADAEPERAAVEAIDLSTGALAVFSVEHDAGTVRAVRYGKGGACRPGGEQFTETAEAFAIDYARQLAARPLA